MLRPASSARSTSRLASSARLARALVISALAAACGGPAPPTSPSPSPSSPAAPAAPVAPDPQVAAAIAGLDQSLAARPTDGVLLFLRAAMAVQASAPADALRFLERLDAAGWSIALSPQDFAPIAEDPRYRALAGRIAARDAPVHRSTDAFTIPGPELIPEGIDVDPATGTFYVGSIRQRTIVSIPAGGGPARPFVPPRRDGLMSVIGLRVDPARGLLWAASNGAESMERYTPADRGVHAVYAFALADGSLRRRIALPAPPAGERHLLNDFAIAPDGAVFVTDSEAGALHRIPPDRDTLIAVVPPRSFFYPNGLAHAPTGQLYVAHATGIALVDPATGSLTRLEAPPTVPLGGIDGLVLHGRALVAVQNGLGRSRLVRIELDDTGRRAVSLTVLENDPRALELPTTTAIYRDHAYTIGNSQLDALTPSGLRPGRPLRDPRIVRTPL